MSEVDRLYVVFDANGKPYVRGLKDIEGQTNRSARTMEDRWHQAGQKSVQALKVASVAMVAAMGAVAIGSIKAASSFEYEMSRIKANADGTSEELAALQAEVLQLGKDTVFSAGQSAQAANELVKAGLTVGETMAALPGMLALASAGELDVAKAAEITANQISVFNLKAKDAGKIADTLALTANRSTTEVGLLGDSLAMVGAVAAQAGLTVEETAAALGLLANNGMKGSDAGTSLKQMFMALMGPSEKATRLMDEYGISAYDSTGKMRDFDEILESLAAGLEGTTDQERDFALATIFGSDAVRSANILLKEGAGSFRDFTAEISQAGAAEDIAATKMDNLKGSWEQLKGSLETAGIVMGTSGLGGLRSIIDGLTESTNEFVDEWNRMTGTNAWQQGGFEVKLDMAAGTIMDTVESLLEKAGEAISSIDWSAVGETIGENAVRLVRSGLRFVVEDLAPMLVELALGLAGNVVEQSARGWINFFERSFENLRTAPWKWDYSPNRPVTPAQTFDLGRGAAGPIGGYDLPEVPEGWSGFDEDAYLAARALDDVTAVAIRAGASVEDLAAVSDLLKTVYESIVSPTDAWTTAINASAEAADIAVEKYVAGKDTLVSWLEEMDKQLAAWEAYEANLLALATEFGPEYGQEVIMAAAAMGPEFLAALVGADDTTQKGVMETLKAGLGANLGTLAPELAALCQPVGTGMGDTMAAATFTGYAGYWVSNILPAPPVKTMGPAGTVGAQQYRGSFQAYLDTHPLQPRVARPGGVIGGEYDSGGYLPPGISIAINNTGVPERVLAPSEGATSFVGMHHTSGPAGVDLDPLIGEMRRMGDLTERMSDRVETALTDAAWQARMDARTRKGR